MRVLNKKYWPYKVSIDIKLSKDANEYLSNNMGNYKDRVYADYKFKKIDYYFRYNYDAVNFSLIFE